MDKSSGALQLVLGKCSGKAPSAQRHSMATVCQTVSLGNLIFHPFKSLNFKCYAPRQNERIICILTVYISRGVPLWVCQEASSNSSQITEGSSDSHTKCMACTTCHYLSRKICWSFTSEPWREEEWDPRPNHKIKIFQVEIQNPYFLASFMILIHIKIGDLLILG